MELALLINTHFTAQPSWSSLHLVHFSTPYFTPLDYRDPVGVYAKGLPKVKVNSKLCSSSSVEPWKALQSSHQRWNHIAPSVLSHLRVPQVLGNVFQQYLLQAHPGNRGEADRPGAPRLSPPVLLEAAAAHSATSLLKPCKEQWCVQMVCVKCLRTQVCLCACEKKKRSKTFGSLTEHDLKNLRKN